MPSLVGLDGGARVVGTKNGGLSLLGTAAEWIRAPTATAVRTDRSHWSGRVGYRHSDGPLCTD